MGQLILVRHGQASFGADDYDVLSETGWEQGRAAGAWLRESGVRPTALVRGSLRRHRETLEALGETAGWGDLAVVEDAGWDEFDHVALVAADAEAPTPDTDRRAFQKLFEEVTARWTAGLVGGGDVETYAAFLARVRTSFARAVQEAGSGRTVVVVSSGGVIAAVCAALVDPVGTGGPDGPDGLDEAAAAAAQAATGRLWERFNTVAVNAALTRVVVGSTGARLLTFNEHPHLAGDLLTYR